MSKILVKSKKKRFREQSGKRCFAQVADLSVKSVPGIYVCMYVCMCSHRITQSQDRSGKVANPAGGQLNRENCLPVSRSRLSIWFRETDSAVPSRVSLLVLRSEADDCAYSRDSSRFPRR